MNNTENPTLIAGFEDVMSYIKNQDARIKSLEKENKKLKLEDDQMEDTLSSLNFYMEANQELKEENKKLKDFALKVHNFAYGTEWDDEDIVSAMDFDGIIEKMKKDEKELTKEVEDMKQQYYTETGENWRSD